VLRKELASPQAQEAHIQDLVKEVNLS
jgi:hypothetical protein